MSVKGRHKYISKVGLILPPGKMVNDIAGFMIGSYAKRILEELEDFDFSGEEVVGYAESVRTTLMNYAAMLGGRNVVSGVMMAEYFAPLDLIGWKNPFGEWWAVQERLEGLGLNGINCQIQFRKVEGAWAEWRPVGWQLVLFAGLPELNDIADFKLAAAGMHRKAIEMKESVEHELIHFVQQIGYSVSGMTGKGFTGLPPMKIRHRDYAPIGFQREDVGLKGTQREHPLRDIEFYTNLWDEMNRFRREVKLVPHWQKERFLRTFVGVEEGGKVSPLFAYLKGYDEKRWKLAVKRFIRYVEDHSEIMK